MNKKILYGIILIAVITFINPIYAVDFYNFNKNLKVSNKLISLAIPDEFKGLYAVEKKKNNIYIYDKISKKSGFGGLAFGVELYKEPKDHAMRFGGAKIGELTDKNNILYDVVLVRPTDVQYDYENGKSDSYDLIYNYADNLGKYIKGINKAEYFDKQGMLGKDLYKDILEKHYKAIAEKWDSVKLENENMSYMYNVIAKSGKNALKNIGYAYYDSNGDGIEELFIGEILKGSLKGIIYDFYTMADRKPVHVASGGSRNRYFISDDYFICNEYPNGAGEKDWHIYVLVENSTELYPQVSFKYDTYSSKKNPWYISYNIPKEGWKQVSKKAFQERKEVFDRYTRLEYIPLSTLKK